MSAPLLNCHGDVAPITPSDKASGRPDIHMDSSLEPRSFFTEGDAEVSRSPMVDPYSNSQWSLAKEEHRKWVIYLTVTYLLSVLVGYLMLDRSLSIRSH